MTRTCAVCRRSESGDSDVKLTEWERPDGSVVNVCEACRPACEDGDPWADGGRPTSREQRRARERRARAHRRRVERRRMWEAADARAVSGAP